MPEISNVSSHGVELEHKYFEFHINLYIIAISSWSCRIYAIRMNFLSSSVESTTY
jgi:hypothetical protein